MCEPRVVTQSSSYRPALDGLRAIAIGAVLLFHSSSRTYLDTPLFPGGRFGVDLFFVLSGFLITRLLLAEETKIGAISLRNFYARRALRLLPALAVFLVFTGVVVLITGRNGDGRNYGLAMLPVIFYVGNWAVAASTKSLGLLGHTWTLALEEQFYIFWPPILRWLLNRGVTVRSIVRGLLLACVGLGGTRAALTVLFPDANIYKPAWRFDGLLLGCVLALVLDRLDTGEIARRLKAPAVGFVALVLLGLVAMQMQVENTKAENLGGLSAFCLIAAVLVGHAALADQESGLNRFLTLSPLVALGRISYGVYLFHIPVNALVHFTPISRQPGLVEVVVQEVASIAVAAASYLLVERRFLAKKERFQPTSAEGVVDAATPQPLEEPAG